MTKNEILKKHKMTEQEFYQRFPTQESYIKEFGNGGMMKSTYANGGQMNYYNNQINQENALMKAGIGLAGNLIAPGVGSVVSGLFGNGGFMPVDQNPDGSKRKRVPGTNMTERTMGIGPEEDGKYYNIPTVIDGKVYSPEQAVDIFYKTGNHTGVYNSQEEADQGANSREKANQGLFSTGLYANGGNLTHMPNASTHEQSPYGGIPIGNNNLVEGNETIFANGGNAGEKYVFSDRLKLGKKTFAALSKDIDRRYSKRPDDKISKDAKERELSNLMEQQEMMRANMQQQEMMANNAQMMNNFAAYGGMFHAYGGAMGKRILGGLGDLPNTLSPEEYDEKFGKPGRANFTFDPNFVPKPLNRIMPNSIQNPGLGLLPNYSPLNPNGSLSVKNPLKEKAGSKLYYNFNGKEYNPESKYVEPISNPNEPNNFKVNPYLLSGIGQGLGDLYNIYQGVRGGDPVNFQRNEYKAADPYATNRLIRDSYREGNSDLATSGLTGSQYIASKMGMASNEAAKIAENNMTYDNMNTQGFNQTGQSNTAISNEEAIARQQERDAARTSISMGLAGLGNKAAGAFKDSRLEKSNDAYNTAMFDVLRNSHNNYEYIMDKDGKTIKLNQKMNAYGGKMKRYY